MDENLIGITNKALAQFIDKNLNIIINDVAERTHCSRLGYEFENLFPLYQINGYYADTEYNRKQEGEVKTILDDKMEVIPIQCDLIIHSRGENVLKDNLIAIEMKKSSRPISERISDRNRLRALTKESYNDEIWSNDGITHPEHVCNYSLGIYLILYRNERYFELEYFYKGDFVKKEIMSF